MNAGDPWFYTWILHRLELGVGNSCSLHCTFRHLSVLEPLCFFTVLLGALIGYGIAWENNIPRTVLWIRVRVFYSSVQLPHFAALRVFHLGWTWLTIYRERFVRDCSLLLVGEISRTTYHCQVLESALTVIENLIGNPPVHSTRLTTEEDPSDPQPPLNRYATRRATQFPEGDPK